ncbi:hypothetical protein OPT61_g10242 [Boeremia exigua]|uniref:Uncharacterized protein n=1 Tax=Boeremia exigua TaxID=749465 RepID=A0ACC2HRI0_9PLEO|nr:hypothetical protein OPT61_g10242 [Boeremia exigua]
MNEERRLQGKVKRVSAAALPFKKLKRRTSYILSVNGALPPYRPADVGLGSARCQPVRESFEMQGFPPCHRTKTPFSRGLGDMTSTTLLTDHELWTDQSSCARRLSKSHSQRQGCHTVLKDELEGPNMCDPETQVAHPEISAPFWAQPCRVPDAILELMRSPRDAEGSGAEWRLQAQLQHTLLFCVLSEFRRRLPNVDVSSSLHRQTCPAVEMRSGRQGARGNG